MVFAWNTRFPITGVITLYANDHTQNHSYKWGNQCEIDWMRLISFRTKILQVFLHKLIVH